MIEGLLLPLLLYSAQTAIPARPEDLRFDELHFEVPEAARFHRELSNGVALYVAPDSTFPLVRLSIQLRQGSYLEPANQVGLAGLTGSLLRTGGTERLDPARFDEEVEFLAAGISAFGGDSRSGASLDCITPVLDSAIELFFEMLRRPRFDEERLAVEKENVLEAMRQRNDDPEDILAREWDWLLEGETFYRARRMTKEHLDAIEREDLVLFHQKYWRPENMILSRLRRRRPRENRGDHRVPTSPVGRAKALPRIGRRHSPTTSLDPGPTTWRRTFRRERWFSGTRCRDGPIGGIPKGRLSRS